MRWALSIRHWAFAAAIASVGCGKKGPPLAPIVRIPGAVEQVEARRRGNEVSLTVTVPAKNIDGSVPVDISRIEIYGYTGNAPPPRAQFLEAATLVGTITVPEQKPDAPPDVAPPPGTPVPGGRATVLELLTPDALVAKPLPPAPVAKRGAPRPLPPVPGATPAAPEAGPLRRFYFALAFSPRGRPGPPSTITEMPLTVLPEPPMELTVTSLPDSVRLEWEPSGGLLGLLLERTFSPEPSPLDDPLPELSGPPPGPALLHGPTRYNVYREIAPLEPTSAPAESVTPTPINPAPLDTLTFVDPLFALDGRKRCYVVRSIRGDVEGVPSEPQCVTPADDFAPAPPTRPRADSSERAITLSWEPNAEPDIAGYLVLRGEAGDATLTPVTDTVVTEARFIDRMVRPGVTYVYAVQAIDSRLPRPNVSGPSERVEATAR
jgi:hypothetical protein